MIKYRKVPGIKMISSITNSFQVVLPQKHLSAPGFSEESDLILEAKRTGDLQSFNELVLRYQDQVYRQAYWLLNDHAAAEDAAQEAFIRAYIKINTFRGDSFLAWIMRITTNYCLDRLRWQKRHISYNLYQSCNSDEENEDNPWLCDPQPSPERMLERSELRETIFRCLLNLPLMYRLPIILVDLQQMSYAEAAGVMGLRMGSFKSRLSRARAFLVSALQETPDYEHIFRKKQIQ